MRYKIMHYISVYKTITICNSIYIYTHSCFYSVYSIHIYSVWIYINYSNSIYMYNICSI